MSSIKFKLKQSEAQCFGNVLSGLIAATLVITNDKPLVGKAVVKHDPKYEHRLVGVVLSELDLKVKRKLVEYKSEYKFAFSQPEGLALMSAWQVCDFRLDDYSMNVMRKIAMELDPKLI